MFPGAIPLRGRGTPLQPPNRFDRISLDVLPERLEEIHIENPSGQRIPTRVFIDHARTIINPVSAPDMPFDWTINPYRGCEHGCIYCYARPTHENFGLSCGTDFESLLYAKVDAPTLFRRELARPNWRAEPIVMSGVTDPYQPIERELRITRRLLEIACECRQPISLITKNAMITRDRDLLGEMATLGCARASVSITTLDNTLAAKLEPRASAPSARLEAIRSLTEAGIPVFVMVAPVIPGLTDREAPAILEAARDAGAVAAGYTLLHLPHQVADLFSHWLQTHFPERAAKVLSLVRQTRSGELSDTTYQMRLRGTGAFAVQLREFFRLARRRTGLDRVPPPLDGSNFVPPEPNDPGQLKLFGHNPVDGVDTHPR